VTGVEADADAAVIVRLGDDRGELLERRPQRRALAGGILEQHHRLAAAARAQQLDQRTGDQRQTVGLVADGVGAGMQHDPEQSERLGAIDFVAHRFERLAPERRVGRREVDQVAAVRDHRADTGGFHLGAKLADFRGRQLAAAPLTGVFREDLQRLAPVHDRAFHRARQPARDRHMRA
jgi:hypothetical protein